MSLLDVSTKARQIEALIGYTFTNKRLAVEAVHMAAPQTAAIFDGHLVPINNNKRLALLGNAVLAKLLCATWFSARDPDGYTLPPADWTSIRNDTLTTTTLAQQGSHLNLTTCILPNPGNPTISAKMLATTLEALVGAVFADGGDPAVQTLVKDFTLLTHPLLTVMSFLPPLALGRIAKEHISCN